MLDSTFDLPGWATAVDPRTGRQYYINLSEKTTSWEDPRKFKSVHIPLQTLHGSPKKIQIYPTQNYPVQAFQNSGHNVSVSASPVPSNRTSHLNYSHTVEMSSLSRSSPHTSRVGSSLAKSTLQETSFTTSPTPMETEATVARVNQMFPTANENHIRMLLKKYHNREALVISALQVEKNPLATPGPYTPPVQRSFTSAAMTLSAFTPPSSSLLSRKSVHHLHGDHITIASSSHGSPMRPQSSASFYTTATTALFESPRFGESMLIRNSPKPHSSPKMKLRYLKSMYPKAEETVILDILAVTENNIQKATEKLIEMGYDKKVMTPAPHLDFTSRKKDNHYHVQEPFMQPTPPPKPKTAEEKKRLKGKLMGQFKAIPEKIITMALESVDYSEDKASKILDIVVQEDKDMKSKKDKKKVDGDDKNVTFKESASGLKNSRSIDLDSAAAIENDETMIINSDHSIITTPVGTPMTDVHVVDCVDGSSTDKTKSMKLLQVEYDETSTSDASSSEAPIIGEKGKRHRTKARSDSNRSEKNKLTKKEDNKENKVVKKVMFEDTSYEYSETPTSPMKSSAAVGPNPNMSKGPRDELLLTDYVTWSGANPDILLCNRSKARGPMASLRADRGTYTPRGHNNEICKGPQRGLAKGSIYAQMTRTNVACN